MLEASCLPKKRATQKPQYIRNESVSLSQLFVKEMEQDKESTQIIFKEMEEDGKKNCSGVLSLETRHTTIKCSQ